MIASALAFAAAALAASGALSLVGGEPRARGSRGPRVLRLLAAAGGGAARRGAPRDLQRRIVAAGRPGGLGARELMAAKLAAAVVGGLTAVLLAGLAPGRLGVLLTVAAPAAGFLAPTCGWPGGRRSASAPSGGRCPRCSTCSA